MYRWYEKASVCYVYLADVENDPLLKRWKDEEWASQQTQGPSTADSPFARSRWFTRGWTLQELLAQEDVQFFSKTFQPLGSKHDLRFVLKFITEISIYALDWFSSDRYCAAEKMSWAAQRQTTRTEDMAYCLFGLFDIHMPLIYGEGRKAFRRLQEEIMKTTNDQTLFAWGADNLRVWNNKATGHASHKTTRSTFSLVGATEDLDGSLFAGSPSNFRKSKFVAAMSVRHVGRDYEMPPMMMGAGLRIALPVISDSDHEGNLSGLQLARKALEEKNMVVAILSCFFTSDLSFCLGIPLISRGEFYSRAGDLVLVSRDGLEVGSVGQDKMTKILYIKQHPPYSKEYRY